MNCPTGKNTYPSKSAAKKHALEAAAKYDIKRRPVPYECPECHRWHLTTPAEQGGRPRWGQSRAGSVRPGQVMSADEAMARLAEMNEERTKR